MCRFTIVGSKSISIWNCIIVSILPFKKLLYLLYHTTLQNTQHLKFYFNIQLIKIILASEHVHAQRLFYFLGKN